MPGSRPALDPSYGNILSSPVKDRNNMLKLELWSGLTEGEGPLVLGASSQTLSLT